MIDDKDGLLPIVGFDELTNWNDLHEACIDFLDVRGTERLEHALSGRVQSVAVERHYIDKDYRDTFSNYHSKRFSTPLSRCIRLHFFDRIIMRDELLHSESIQDSYLGYSVIRPTRPNCIGRTLFAQKLYSISGAYTCQCTETVHIHGSELIIQGFPFISQDADATVCAQSALWMILRYYSNKYPMYKETYPFQLTQLTEDYSIGRLYPSNGLTMWQLAESLRKVGFSPLVYSRKQYKDQFDRLLYTYIESGIPVLAGVPDHVVAAYGHISNFSKLPTLTKNAFSAHFCTGIIVNDDNCMPCETLNKEQGGQSPYLMSDIDSFIAPLAEKIFLSAENFEKVVLQALIDEKVGIKALSPVLSHETLVFRMYLTTVKSYKSKLTGRNMGNPTVEQQYRQLPLPHFIWVGEISTPVAYNDGQILGEIIWDATRNVAETEGWIAIHYPEVLLLDLGSALNNKQEIFKLDLTNSGAYPIYCSNLKEV